MKSCGNCADALTGKHRERKADGSYDEWAELVCNSDESVYECEQRDAGDCCEEWRSRRA